MRNTGQSKRTSQKVRMEVEIQFIGSPLQVTEGNLWTELDEVQIYEILTKANDSVKKKKDHYFFLPFFRFRVLPS
jgi:hypothetical protein